ncbi:MAG: FAD-dependent oxidoreductase [Pseudomonadota bacterium]
MKPDARIVVVGAGQAGASLVARLRAGGHEGPITMIGAEPVPPYQRPPLSKKYLLGEMQLERLYLRPERFYKDQNIALRLNTRATGIDRTKRLVHLSDGSALPYDALALTTGSTPRRLPDAVGGALPGVFVMRDLADADALADYMVSGKRALIVGGGYIGLEAAAVAASRGVSVVLVEQAERILARVASRETADYFRELHQGHGVDIREGAGLVRLSGEDHVARAELTDGTHLDIDFALVGIGISPGTSLAEQAGLIVENGIVVDAQGRTSDAAIFAAGDCANFPYRGGRLRLESVPHAIEQADAVADVMLGGTVPYEAKPWFWSDQFDVKLQIAGLNTGYTETILRPGARTGSQSVWYFDGDTLLAVDAMNDPRNYMMGKRLIENGISPSQAQVSDPDFDLKSLL